MDRAARRRPVVAGRLLCLCALALRDGFDQPAEIGERRIGGAGRHCLAKLPRIVGKMTGERVLPQRLHRVLGCPQGTHGSADILRRVVERFARGGAQPPVAARVAGHVEQQIERLHIRTAGRLGEQFAEHRDGRQRDVAAGGNRGPRDGQAALVGDRFEHSKDRDLPIAVCRRLEGGDELGDDAASEDGQTGDRRFATIAVLAQGLQQGADVVCRQPSGPSSRLRRRACASGTPRRRRC